MKTKLHNNETYSANRSLETIIWVFGLALLFVVFSYTSASANPVRFEEETYIDDIPFDTEMIVKGILTPEFDFEEEAYIDDIPFNTACVTAKCFYKKAIAVAFDLDEEKYIDDLPFSTIEVAQQYNFNQSVSIEFEMENENYIDDIPFDTYQVASKSSQFMNNDSLTAKNK